ncbi:MULTISPECIES: hypothetical protein [Modicisalibacter]|uniref:Uncharacterized protein n=1 Tax=Modicisalibacter tunisiensis TaxID=390637 RepID=A0ABS7X317_9GAMM|nr:MULTISPECIES: hypothetical protein [Modicisalibacter]MBZ9538099.1 hypothetical protein [Modicisalibacter tunisiensis]MBZ9568491.1 hypothetical protein [Modicisalibacter tunisiensis]
MEVTLQNAGEIDSTFHEMVAGDAGTALRKTGRDFIGSRNLSENQLRAMQRDDPEAFERLEAEMTRHALEVNNVALDAGIALKLNLEGDKAP